MVAVYEEGSLTLRHLGHMTRNGALTSSARSLPQSPHRNSFGHFGSAYSPYASASRIESHWRIGRWWRRPVRIRHERQRGCIPHQTAFKHTGFFFFGERPDRELGRHRIGKHGADAVGFARVGEIDERAGHVKGTPINVTQTSDVLVLADRRVPAGMFAAVTHDEFGPPWYTASAVDSR